MASNVENIFESNPLLKLLLSSKLKMCEMNIILNELKGEKEILKNVKLFYVFNKYTKSVIIVTNDDKTYAFGNNRFGVLGFGHKNEVEQLTIVEELCDKGIVEFKGSTYHTMARTIDGKLYSWGRNESGVLGNGKEAQNLYKPQLNEYLKEKIIIAMCCEELSSFALTNDGLVFGWGINGWGPQFYKDQLTPYLFNQFYGEKVKSISSGRMHSLALTHSGRVYSWGLGHESQLGRAPLHYHDVQPIELSEEIIIKQISCGPEHSLLLSREGDLYVFGSNRRGELGIGQCLEVQKGVQKCLIQELIPLKLEISRKFKEIASHSNYRFSCALSTNGEYYVWGQLSKEVIITEPKVTQFKSFNEIFLHYFGITYWKAIDVKLIYECIHAFIRNGFYDKQFHRKMR